MKEQIIKGWVTTDPNEWETDEICLVKSNNGTIKYEDRELRNLISNALIRLGSEDTSTHEDYEYGISERRAIKNVEMQLYASDTQEKLETIKEKIILQSMGLIYFEENWVGYSEWTITGYVTETFMLGGHNVLEIIKSLKGKYIYLVINRIEDNIQ